MRLRLHSHPWLYRLLWRLYPKPIMNRAARTLLPSLSMQLPSDGLILNLGSGEDMDPSMRALRAERGDYIVNLDIVPFAKVDVVGDGHRLPFESETFELVVMKCLLEHVEDPSVVVDEAYRVMKEGAFVYSETPFVSRFHGGADYRRWTPLGLNRLFERFEKVESGVACGPASALALSLREFTASFADHPYLHMTLKFLANWACFPLKYLDLYLAKRKHAYKLAQSLYFVGVKRESA